MNSGKTSDCPRLKDLSRHAQGGVDVAVLACRLLHLAGWETRKIKVICSSRTQSKIDFLMLFVSCDGPVQVRL